MSDSEAVKSRAAYALTALAGLDEWVRLNGPRESGVLVPAILAQNEGGLGPGEDRYPSLLYARARELLAPGVPERYF